MATNIKLKEAFEAESQFGAFFTGGIVAWTSTGEEFLCQDVGKINVINIDSGNIVNSIGDEPSVADLEEDVVYTFALSADDEHILTAHKSGLLKMWEKSNGSLKKMWKSAHKGPVARLAFRSRGGVVASGGSDASVRIWDYDRKTCLCALHDSQGVVALVQFHPDVDNTLVFGSGDDNKINCWDYACKTLKTTFTGHYSKVTAISFEVESKVMASVSRDKVLILWNIETGAQIKVLPLYEGLEGVCILPKTLKLPNGFDLAADENKDKIFAAVAGEHGYIRIWNCSDAKNIYSQTNSSVSKATEDGGLAVTQLLQCSKTNQLAMITADHNIIVHNISTFHCAKQLIGFSDEILDICFVGKNSRYLAVATNSSDIKFYDTTNMNCSILKGHSDIVLALSSYKNFLLSSSKDNTIRIWELDSGSFSVRCVAKGTKHTSSVGSVAFGRMSHTICVSVSQDTCLKVWEVPKKFSAEITDEADLHSLVCTTTAIAHEKDVNCVAISPNDQIIATASQDKTAKLWDSKSLSLLGVLRGHRRGVWCVRFSPIDQILLTTSADCSLRLWSLTDMTCLKTIEGHESSVLRAEFISKGMQLVSAGGDGLIKLWNIKNSECTLTLDKHEARIWTLAVPQSETHFFSGGADSKLIRWRDVTEEKKLNEIQERQEIAAQEQELANLIAQKKMLKALRLALKLEKPFLTLKIINTVIKTGESGLAETIGNLNNVHKESLMRHAITWNTNSRNCRPAQLVLNILINLVLANEFRPSNLGRMIEETLPYTERHFKRMTEYLKDLKFIEFTLKCMQTHGEMDVDIVDK